MIYSLALYLFERAKMLRFAAAADDPNGGDTASRSKVATALAERGPFVRRPQWQEPDGETARWFRKVWK